jgi:predicted DCC family thiol-disulfide oxidoreductase YuxK
VPNSSSGNPQETVIFYDGVCNLCNAAVQFVLKRDKKAVFTFCSLQSYRAKELLPAYFSESNEPSSIVLKENNHVYTESTAALRICKHLRGLWPVLYVFILVPRFVRDGVYRFIARNRYKWFGQSESCPSPKPEWQERFLD